MKAEFPNGKFVCLVRDPVESIPSMVSYISYVWRAFSCPIQKYPSTKTLLGYCRNHYLYPIKVFVDELPVEQYKFVYYHKLKKEILREVLHLFRDLELPLPSPSTLYKILLKREQRATDAFKSSHSHPIESVCGISAEQLRIELGGVYEMHKDLYETCSGIGSTTPVQPTVTNKGSSNDIRQ
jgi:hypothetical protein